MSEKCSICGEELPENSAQYNTGASKDIKVCSVCEGYINILQKSTNPEKIKISKNYFSPYIMELTNEEVLKFLEDIYRVADSLILNLFAEKNKQFRGVSQMENKQNEGIVPTCIGTLLAIGGIFGLFYVINTVTNPLFDFIFGFGTCDHELRYGMGICICERLSMTLVASMIATIFGVIIGVKGFTSLINK